MIENKFIQLKAENVATEYRVCEISSKPAYAFAGNHDSEGKPDGFVRCVNQFGNIYEGTFTPDFKMHGFCVSYLGEQN